MKAAIAPATAALTLLLVFVWLPSEVRAGVHQDWLRTGGELGWHSGVPGKRHPKKTMSAALIVDQNFLNSDGIYSFCITYSRLGESSRPDKGIVKATFEVIKSNGERPKARKLSAKVSDHWASRCTGYILLPLDLSDVVLFRFKFKKMPPFDEQSNRAVYSGRVLSGWAPWLAVSAEE